MITVRKVTSPVSDVGILLGRQGENEARRIVFDLSWLIDTYGDGTAQLVHKRSKDRAPYAISTTQEENTLTWIVTNTDTAYDGGGEAELRWTVNNTLAKTITYQTIIIHSITADAVLPDPYKSWYDALIEYINERSISPEDLADAVAEYISEHPIEAPVMSVNSKTGDVVLSASDVGAGTYSKPANGIPKTDLASSVQTSLGKADTALQSFTETDPTVPSWAKQQNKPIYTAQEVGALPSDTTIPTKVSQLQNDSGFGTYSKPSGGIPKTDLASAVQTSLDKADSALQTAPVTSVNNKTGAVTLSASDVGAGTYSKPSGGIPSSDMTSSVQTSLGKADSAYQKPSGGIPSTDMSSAVQTSLGKADTALQTAPVSSVNSKTGAVTLAAGDIGYDDEETYSAGSVGAELSSLKGGITEITTGTSEDIGKALSPKTVSSGKVTEWQYVAIGGGGGGGSVDSVNGKTGTVVLDADDVGAISNEKVKNKLSDWMYAHNKYFNASFVLTDVSGYDTYKIPCDATDYVVVMWTGDKPFGTLTYYYAYEDTNGFTRSLTTAYYKEEMSSKKVAFIAPADAKAIYFTFKADLLSGLTVVKNTTREYYADADVADSFMIPVNASTAIDARFYLRVISNANTIYSYTNTDYHTWWIHVDSGDVIKFAAAVEGMSYNAVFYNSSNVLTQITALTYTFDTDATLVIFEKATVSNNAVIIKNGAKLAIDAANVFGIGALIAQEMPDYDDQITALDTRLDNVEAQLGGSDITYSAGDTSGYYRVSNNAIEKASSSSFTCKIVEVTESMLSVSFQIKSTSGISSNIIYCGFADSNNAFISKVDVAVGTYDLEIPNTAKYIYLSFFGDTYNSAYTIKANSFITKKDMNSLGISNPYEGLTGVAFGTSLTYRAQTTGGYLQYLPSLLGVTIDNQGIGSGVIKGDGGGLDVLSHIKSYSSYSGKRICLLEGFVNDWYGNNTLGTYTDTSETTVCGCVRSALNYIMSQNANLTLFLILDHYGRSYGGADCSSTAENGSNLTQYEFYSEIEKVADSLGIPVISLYKESQISENTPQYLTDNIHPTALGAKQTANFIWKKIISYMPNLVN